MEELFLKLTKKHDNDGIEYQVISDIKFIDIDDFF